MYLKSRLLYVANTMSPETTQCLYNICPCHWLFHCPSTNTRPPFLRLFRETTPLIVAFYNMLGIQRIYSHLKHQGSPRGVRDSNYAQKLPPKCDYQSDKQMDSQKPDIMIPINHSSKPPRHKIILGVKVKFKRSLKLNQMLLVLNYYLCA